MKRNRVRLVLIVAAAAVVAVSAVGWALPRLVAALPGRVRQYVPEGAIELVTTPLPTALPAPAEPVVAALELALGTAVALPTEAVRGAAMPQSAATLSSPEGSLAATPASTIPAPATAIPSPTVPSLAPYGRIDGLPIIPQKFNNCGPTNLTIVLNHYGIDVDQFDVAGIIRPNYEDRNVSPEELVSFVNGQTGLAAAAYAGGDLALLRRLIAAGFPVIIEEGLEPDEATGWMGHYLTVYGYDDITSHFSVRDTYLGPWEGDGLASYRDLERYWAQFNGTFVVVYPPERAAELAGILGPAFADPAAMWSAAAERSRAALAANPRDAFAWFSLGTNLTETAKVTGNAALFEAAAAAFDQARVIGLPARMLWYQFGPYVAYLATGRHADVLALAEATLVSQGGRNVEETYLFQGRALAMAGDGVGARVALARAAELNPESPVGAAARAELGDG